MDIKLTDMEKKVFAKLVLSSEANGHDFGMLEDLFGNTEWQGELPDGITAEQARALVTSIQNKGLITVYGPEKVNGRYWVTQFVITEIGIEIAESL